MTWNLALTLLIISWIHETRLGLLDFNTSSYTLTQEQLASAYIYVSRLLVDNLRHINMNHGFIYKSGIFLNNFKTFILFERFDFLLVCGDTIYPETAGIEIYIRWLRCHPTTKSTQFFREKFIFNSKDVSLHILGQHQPYLIDETLLRLEYGEHNCILFAMRILNQIAKNINFVCLLMSSQLNSPSCVSFSFSPCQFCITHQKYGSNWLIDWSDNITLNCFII